MRTSLDGHSQNGIVVFAFPEFTLTTLRPSCPCVFFVPVSLIHRSFPTSNYEKWFFSLSPTFFLFHFFLHSTMPKGGFKLKSNFFKWPFFHQGKKKTVKDQEDGIQALSSYEDSSTTVGETEPSPRSANTDATSTTRGSRSSFDANASQQGPNLPMTRREFSSTDGRVRVFFFFCSRSRSIVINEQ